ncbi:MAG TPA: hypothetical protein VMM76_10170 [Pirellulaceae bacterium]|nr:hypothetical protein [Pirellulaceae bacterium]
MKLALSLHGVRQDVRQPLLPFAAKYSLDELQRTVVAVSRRQTARAMIEYLMLAGVNDSQADARELVAWLAGFRVHVNVMPYNPIDHAPRYKPAAQASEPSRRDLHIFKQVGTRAFGTAFTRWRVGLVLSMIDRTSGDTHTSRPAVVSGHDIGWVSPGHSPFQGGGGIFGDVVVEEESLASVCI